MRAFVLLAFSALAHADSDLPSINAEVYQHFMTAISQNGEIAKSATESACSTNLGARAVELVFQQNNKDGSANTYAMVPLTFKPTGKSGDTWKVYEFTYLVGTSDRLHKMTRDVRVTTKADGGANLVFMNPSGPGRKDQSISSIRFLDNQPKFNTSQVCKSLQPRPAPDTTPPTAAPPSPPRQTTPD